MTTNTSPIKVLLVEDDIAMREIVARKLASNSFMVKEAEDGRIAIELIPQEKPNIILLDLMMPETDGFSVLEYIRGHEDESIKNTPVIVLSNLWSNTDIQRIKKLSAQAYLVKAYFTTDEILQKVLEILENPDTKFE